MVIGRFIWRQCTIAGGKYADYDYQQGDYFHVGLFFHNANG